MYKFTKTFQKGSPPALQLSHVLKHNLGSNLEMCHLPPILFDVNPVLAAFSNFAVSRQKEILRKVLKMRKHDICFLFCEN